MSESPARADDGAASESDRSRDQPAPAAFHLGPGHRIMHGNPPFIELFGAEAIGQPAREAMLGLPAKAFQLMDLVLEQGRPGAVRIATRLGPRRLVVAPRSDPETGETYGVTTHLRAVDATTR